MSNEQSKAKQNKTNSDTREGKDKKKISIQGKGKKKLYKDLGF